jgi:hypothetical protein
MRAGLFIGAAIAAAFFAAPSAPVLGESLLSAPVNQASHMAGVSTPVEAHAPERLARTGLYELGRPFSPQYPLWSDGAAKTRWVYLPPGTMIDGTDEQAWTFPVGTRFWKEFTFNGRKAETRMLWKASADRWIAASYVWNEEGTDAVLAAPEGAVSNVDVAPGRRHMIPSRDECLMCHGTRQTGPLGFTALQLSVDRDPNAIHGEPISPGMVTLETLVAERLLASARPDLIDRPPSIRTSDSSTRAVLGYLSTNCGSCHNGRGEIAALGPILKISELLRDGDAVARGLVGQATHWQVPGVPEGESVLINPDMPEKSALLVRMRSRRPSSQMPPLGTTIRDERAIDAIKRWVDTQVVRSH